MARIRIFVVDNSQVFLNAATRFLAQYPYLEIVGTALSGKEALQRMRELTADLVLIDIIMPEMDGLTTTGIIKEQQDPPCVIIMSMHNVEQYHAHPCIERADGFINKSDFSDKLIPLIHALFPKQHANT
jgi:DNA-binding NarL/FixJ family response regulator